MKELQRRLNELMNKATEITGSDFDYPEDAITELRESDDEEYLELAQEIDDVLYEIQSEEEIEDFNYDENEEDDYY